MRLTLARMDRQMIGFWISAIAMVLMVGLLLAQAMRRAGSSSALDDRSADLAVYRDQLAEVEQDQTRGVLSADEAARLRLEVQRRLLDADRRSTPAKSKSGAGGILALGAVGGGMLIALALYFFDLGAPGYPDLPLGNRLAAAEEAYANRPSQSQAEAAQPAYQAPADIDPALAALLDQLRAALTERPDDLQGHQLLARNEAQLGNFRAARAAQEAVVRIAGDQVTAGDLAFLAHLMIAAAGGQVTAEAEAVLIRGLQIDPTEGWARYYSGLMFAQIGRPDRTFDLWEPLLRESRADAPYLAPIQAMIQDVADAAGVAYAPATPGGPSAEDMAAAADMSEADRAEMIRGMVGGLEEQLMSQGGPLEDWAKLVTSLAVLGEMDRARAALKAGLAALDGQPGELAALKAAAEQAGVTE